MRGDWKWNVKSKEYIEGERNANGNQAVPLENRLKCNFVGQNIVNLSNGTLMMRRFLYCRKDLILFQHAAIYIKLRLKWNSRPLVKCYV